MPNWDPKANELFTAALECSGPHEQKSFLDGACGDDAELRNRVEALLEANQQVGDFLNSPAPALDSLASDSLPEGAGTQIGPYKLLESIGEGGFGRVYLAEQQRPMRRRVALKIIKPGMDSRQVIARFDAERQALAMMDHPNIAKVFDAGATENGRPYFVMELVQGVPITEYCDQCSLTTRERLALFLTVCHAVQHAHQKGVIHRDIKPTNVLVAIQDGKPAPKIIDFGVAKALNQRLTEHTLATGYAQMIGTPLYMSPEQAELSPLGADTRSDIYSLGVLLYELFTGTTPFDKDRLHSAGYDELRRILREEDPPRPSARISTLAADLATTVADRRRTEPRRLSQTIRGELDWIVMKCLEKDRNRRYESASSLAADLQCYLQDEPVQACPPSIPYRLKKFVRRHKAAAAFVGLLVISVAGLAGSNIALKRERDAKMAALAKATTETAKARAVSELLQEMLASAKPDLLKGANYTVRELLDDFSAGLGDQLVAQPEVEATLRQIIGVVYTRLGLLEDAEPHLQRSLELYRECFGEHHVKYAEGLLYLASNRFMAGHSAEAEQFARQALAISRAEHDADGMIMALWELQLSLGMQSQFEEAEQAANEALSIARVHRLEEHDKYPDIIHHLSWIKLHQGDYRAAERLARKSLELHLRLDGETHPETGFGWRFLGEALRAQGKLAEAEACFRRALEIHRAHFSPDQWFVTDDVENLMDVLIAQGNEEVLEQFHREELTDLARALEHIPESWANWNNRLAWLLVTRPEAQLRDPAEALRLASKAVELAPNTADFWNTLGVAQYRDGNFTDAISSLQKYRDLRTTDAEWSNPFWLTMAHHRLGNEEEAREWFDKGAQWMDAHNANNETMVRIRNEAAELLDAAQSQSPPDPPLQEN